jgi:phenylacetate-CoA ligase
MAKVTGRNDDMMIVRGVNVFPSQIEEKVLAQALLSPHYQIELTRTGNLDALVVHVELKANVGSDSMSGEVSAALAHDIKTHIGITTEIIVHSEGGVPRSQGKAQRVIDSR